MPDLRKHRGPHPQDGRLFSGASVIRLRRAVADLCWLLSRNYPENAAGALVGDRYRLPARLRVAMSRMACSDGELENRRRHAVSDDAALSSVVIDGFNVLITVESAFGGAVVLEARDGCYRDLAGLRGTYRTVAETVLAIEATGRVLAARGNPHATWLFDRPVSNSGRLATLVRETAFVNGWPWEAVVQDNVDETMASTEAVVASADSAVLDRVERWMNLASDIVRSEVPHAWVVSP